MREIKRYESTANYLDQNVHEQVFLKRTLNVLKRRSIKAALFSLYSIQYTYISLNSLVL